MTSNVARFTDGSGYRMYAYAYTTAYIMILTMMINIVKLPRFHFCSRLTLMTTINDRPNMTAVVWYACCLHGFCTAQRFFFNFSTTVSFLFVACVGLNWPVVGFYHTQIKTVIGGNSCVCLGQQQINYPFSSLSFPFPPPSPFPLPLEKGPILRLEGLGALKLPQRVRAEPGRAAKRFLMNFKLKIAYLVAIVLRSFSANATTWSDIKRQ